MPKRVPKMVKTPDQLIQLKILRIKLSKLNHQHKLLRPRVLKNLKEDNKILKKVKIHLLRSNKIHQQKSNKIHQLRSNKIHLLKNLKVLQLRRLKTHQQNNSKNKLKLELTRKLKRMRMFQKNQSPPTKTLTTKLRLKKLILMLMIPLKITKVINKKIKKLMLPQAKIKTHKVYPKKVQKDYQELLGQEVE